MSNRRQKSRWTKPLIAVAVILAVVMGSFAITGNEFIISGYGGIVSSIIDVDHDYSDAKTYNTGLIAGVDPVAYYNPYPITSNPTGVRIEIQGKVNLDENKKFLPDVNKTTDNGDGTYTHTMVSASIVTCQMGITFRTEGEGLDQTTAIDYTIKLEENQFDVFSGADDVESYILEVYTRGTAIKNTSLIQVRPASGGYTFPMTPISTGDAPQWIIDAGYQSSVSKLKVVSFEVSLDKATPSNFWGIGRAEVTAVMDIGIDVLVFGYWEETGTNKDWKPPKDDVGFLAGLLLGLADLMDVMGPMVMMITIIAVAIVIVVVIVKFGWMVKKK